MRFRSAKLLLVLTAVAMLAASASACPVCDGETGRAVRTGIVGSDLGVSLLATVTPFVVVVGVVACIHFGGPRRWRRRSAGSPATPAEERDDHAR